MRLRTVWHCDVMLLLWKLDSRSTCAASNPNTHSIFHINDDSTTSRSYFIFLNIINPINFIFYRILFIKMKIENRKHITNATVIFPPPGTGFDYFVCVPNDWIGICIRGWLQMTSLFAQHKFADIFGQWCLPSCFSYSSSSSSFSVLPSTLNMLEYLIKWQRKSIQRAIIEWMHRPMNKRNRLEILLTEL